MLPGVENKEQPRGNTYGREMVPMDRPDGSMHVIPVYRRYDGQGGSSLITAEEFHEAVARGEQIIDQG